MLHNSTQRPPFPPKISPLLHASRIRLTRPLLRRTHRRRGSSRPRQREGRAGCSPLQVDTDYWRRGHHHHGHPGQLQGQGPGRRHQEDPGQSRRERAAAHYTRTFVAHQPSRFAPPPQPHNFSLAVACGQREDIWKADTTRYFCRVVSHTPSTLTTRPGRSRPRPTAPRRSKSIWTR